MNENLKVSKQVFPEPHYAPRGKDNPYYVQIKPLDAGDQNEDKQDDQSDDDDTD